MFIKGTQMVHLNQLNLNNNVEENVVFLAENLNNISIVSKVRNEKVTFVKKPQMKIIISFIATFLKIVLFHSFMGLPVLRKTVYFFNLILLFL